MSSDRDLSRIASYGTTHCYPYYLVQTTRESTSTPNRFSVVRKLPVAKSELAVLADICASSTQTKGHVGRHLIDQESVHEQLALEDLLRDGGPQSLSTDLLMNITTACTNGRLTTVPLLCQAKWTIQHALVSPSECGPKNPAAHS